MTDSYQCIFVCVIDQPAVSSTAEVGGTARCLVAPSTKEIFSRYFVIGLVASFMKCYSSSLFPNLIHITVVYKMRECLMNSVGGFDTTSALRNQSRHRNCQFDDTGHSRYNDATYSDESSTKLDYVVSLNQTEMENVGTAHIGYGDQYLGRSTQQLPSTEILRLFHESFPHVCLSEDPLSDSAYFLGRSDSSIEIPDVRWGGDCPGGMTCPSQKSIAHIPVSGCLVPGQ
jgi:hypothetical protein